MTETFQKYFTSFYLYEVSKLIHVTIKLAILKTLLKHSL